MTFDEYMARFRLLQHGAEQDERTLKLLQGKAYRAFAGRFEKTEDPVLSALLLTEKRIRERHEKRQRLCERYARRIATAVSRIESPALREYALYRYLYGLTHEEIAEQSFFCVRTVYRHGKQAKKELEKALLDLQPRPRRWGHGTYHVKGGLPRRNRKVDQVTKSVAFSTARRRSLPYRPLPLYR